MVCEPQLISVPDPALHEVEFPLASSPAELTFQHDGILSFGCENCTDMAGSQILYSHQQSELHAHETGIDRAQ